MKKDVYVEVAFQHNDSYNENVYSFVNNINTHDGGTHEDGVKRALTRIINNYAKSDLLPSPHKKKYSKEHLLLLTFIYYF